jgi:hypothetical protein
MEIQRAHQLSKNLFYLMLLAGCYFTLVFTGLMGSSNFAVVGAVFELFTIPLMVTALGIFIYLTREIFIRHKMRNLYAYCSIAISAAILFSTMYFTIINI